jgi:hypothetical protein
MVIVTLGITDPEGSVIVPTIVACCPNAEIDRAKTSAQRINKWRIVKCFTRRKLAAEFM